MRVHKVVKMFNLQEVPVELVEDMESLAALLLLLPPSFLVENLRLVLFQRQVKILCAACKKPNPVPARELFKNKKLSGDYPVFREAGCPECQSSGYGGEEIVYEVFTLDNQERPQFHKRYLAALDRKISEAGNLTIAQKVLNRVLKGDVSHKESGRFF